MSRFFLTVLLALTSLVSFSQASPKQRWVDSVFSRLSIEEKIGQKIMGFFSPRSQSAAEQAEQIRLIRAGKMGGLYIGRTGVMTYAKKMNELQSAVNVPILIGYDCFHNTAEEFDSLVSFYRDPIESSASDSIKRKIRVEREKRMKALGIHLSFNNEELEVEGLFVTEALNLSPTASSQELKTKVKEVLSSPADIYLMVWNIDHAEKLMAKTVKKDKAAARLLDQSVKKILAKKYEVGLSKNRYINTDNLLRKVNPTEVFLIRQQLAQETPLISKNISALIPIRTLNDKTFASISIGASPENDFTHYLNKYAPFHHESILNATDTTSFRNKLRNTDVVVIGLFSQTMAEQSMELVRQISKDHRVIICNFTEHSYLGFENSNTIIEAYTSDKEFLHSIAQIIFGGLHGKIKTTESISDSVQVEKWITTKTLNRFSYQLPEVAGMDSRTLEKIDAIANEAITMGSTPCLSVLVAKDGKVVYEKSFGTITYENKKPATDETIFDLASITKVSATLQAVAYIYEKGLIDINKKASFYLPELKGSNKEDYTIKDILTHQAGLWPFLPFWVETVKDSATWKKYYSRTSTESYPYPVAEKMFASKSMKDSLWQWIIKSRVIEKPVRTAYSFKYSDMGFYIMYHLAEKILGERLEDFLQKNIYQSMGAYTTGYLPLRKFPSDRIAPTERDTLFRKSLLIGYVHDQGAAMHGGIAGHAGLFSTANDLAKLGQMWLWGGTYGGIQYFKPETIQLFTSQQYEPSSRALGWDKAIHNNPSISRYASEKTFGHTGFTGPNFWIDPEFNLVFICMSNRVYPDMNNRKILNANIRPRIQDVVYQSIFEYCKNHDTSLKPNELNSGLTVKP